MEILTIINSVLLLFLTFWNILLLRDGSKMKKREEQRLLEDRRKAEIDACPRLEIDEIAKEYGDDKQKVLKDCDLNILIVSIKEYKKGEHTYDFYYEDGVIDRNNWVSATYKFKNIGKTEILSLEISTNLMKDTALFDVEYVSLIEKHCLNYSALLDKTIKPGETFTLKINYMKERIIGGLLGSATLTIWMQDVYKEYWAQSFFAHEGKLYNSRRESYENYRIFTQIDTALECFEKPWMW